MSYYSNQRLILHSGEEVTFITEDSTRKEPLFVKYSDRSTAWVAEDAVKEAVSDGLDDDMFSNGVFGNLMTESSVPAASYIPDNNNSNLPPLSKGGSTLFAEGVGEINTDEFDKPLSLFAKDSMEIGMKNIERHQQRVSEPVAGRASDRLRVLLADNPGYYVVRTFHQRTAFVFSEEQKEVKRFRDNPFQELLADGLLEEIYTTESEKHYKLKKS